MTRPDVKFAASFLLLLFLASFVANADDLPARLRAKGSPDTMLAGIDVYTTTVREAIAKLGKPAKVVDYPETGPVAGGRDYEWDNKRLKLVCSTWNDKGENSHIYSVEEWGVDTDGKTYATGRGLTLGSTLSEIHRIYGQRIVVSKLGNGVVQITIQWRDDTTLYLFLNKSGHLDHMQLLAATD